MKNLSKLFAIALGVVFAGTTVMAETTQFTPLNFSDSTSVSTSTKSAVTTDTQGNVLLDPSQVTGGTKMQNAILQIDNAQVEIRNKLLWNNCMTNNVINQSGIIIITVEGSDYLSYHCINFLFIIHLI